MRMRWQSRARKYAPLLVPAFVVAVVLAVALVWGAVHAEPVPVVLGTIGLVSLVFTGIELARRRCAQIVSLLNGHPRGRKLVKTLRSRRANRIEKRVTRFLQDERPLEAMRSIPPGVERDINATLLRRLSRMLQARGYLGRARDLLGEVVRRRGAEGDIEALRRLDGVIGLLRGASLPVLDSEPLTERVESRVLHVVKRDLRGSQAGYTLRTHLTARAQATAGRDVHVVTQLGIHEIDETGLTWVQDEVTYHRLDGPSIGEIPQDEWFAQYTRALAECVRDLRPEVLHAASDFVNARAARIVGMAFGIPVVYEVRGFWEETMISSQSRRFDWDMTRVRRRYGLPDTYLWRKQSEAVERARAGAVVTLAPVMKDKIVAEGTPPERVTIVPNAIDPAEFAPVARDLGLVRRLGFREDTTVVGYVSSLSEYEGIDTLVRAFARMRASRRQGGIGLLIVGDGGDRERLEKVADEVGSEGIVFTGRVPHTEVKAYYGVIDVFVVPRQPVDVCRLVTPLKPYEAFALERAVVMSDVEALAGIASESASADLAVAGNPRSFASVISKLIDDDVRRRDMAERARRWVTTERTWQRNALLYEEVYRHLVRSSANDATVSP